MIEPPDARARVLFSAVADPRALAEEARRAGRTLKMDSRSRVRLLEASSAGPIVVKTITLTRPKDRLNALLGRTQLQRQVRGARLLHSIGVATAEPLLLIRGGGRETLVLRASPGRSLLQLMDDVHRRRAGAPGLAAQRAVASAIGAQLQRFAGATLFNRDHKPSNLIVDLAGEAPTIAVIDTVAIRPDRLSVGGLRMLVSLMLEPLGCACPPSRTMRMRVLLAATTDENRPDGAPLVARKAAWRAVEQAIEEHGDPTPKVNPLA